MEFHIKDVVRNMDSFSDFDELDEAEQARICHMVERYYELPNPQREIIWLQIIHALEKLGVVKRFTNCT